MSSLRGGGEWKDALISLFLFIVGFAGLVALFKGCGIGTIPE